jgi:hypothetical protein
MSGTLRQVLSVFHIVDSEVFTATMLRIHCYVPVAIPFISCEYYIIDNNKLGQKYKWNTSFFFFFLFLLPAVVTRGRHRVALYVYGLSSFFF